MAKPAIVFTVFLEEKNININIYICKYKYVYIDINEYIIFIYLYIYIVICTNVYMRKSCNRQILQFKINRYADMYLDRGVF